MADWTISRADARDADALAACMTAAYAPHAARLDDLPPVADDCAGEIARHQVWVANLAGSVAGGLVLVPQGGFMLVANIAVHPGHQGAGLGRALMAHAEAEAAAQGYRELRLTTHAKMPDAIGLYTRLGWRRTGRRGNKVSMRKRL